MKQPYKQTLLFDLDDTLIHCNKYFNMAIDLFTAQMAEWFSAYGIDTNSVKQKQLELDLQSVHMYGLALEHFPQSFVDTYRYYCEITGRTPSRSEGDSVLRLGQSVYEQEIEPYPHMHETLSQLRSAGHDLYLYTGGDPSFQQQKIDRVGLRDYFGDRVYVTRHKNADTLRSIANENRFDVRLTWMIGNSARTDILPALEVGLHAIHIPAEVEWQYNVMDIHIEPKGAFVTVSTLQQVPEVINRYSMTKLA